MSATELTNSRISYESFTIKPPVHPTYDLKGIIKLALAEDSGDRGCCLNFFGFFPNFGFIVSIFSFFYKTLIFHCFWAFAKKILIHTVILQLYCMHGIEYENVSIVGDVTCLATIPFDMEVEAYFLAKEEGIVAGIALAEMIFHEVDPSLKV